MESHVIETQGCSVLTLAGRMDASTAHILEEQGQALLDAGVKKLVIDLGGIVYMSSAGLRSVLLLQKAAKAAHCAVAFCAAQPMVVDVFRIAGFNRILTLYATRADALAKP